jgi:hypothetical protein
MYGRILFLRYFLDCLAISYQRSKSAQHFPATMPIQRINSFKVNDDADVDKMIEQYRIIKDTNKKVRGILDRLPRV